MKTHNTAAVAIRDNTCETATIFGWGWPDEAQLAAFAEQGDRAAENDRAPQTDRLARDDVAYAALHFVS
jgi:hypothetical protein